jgi:regulator of protease activity HflC (stomatin/prohibitin superfamily)
MLVGIVIGVLAVLAVVFLGGGRVVQQYEKGLVFRLGRLREKVYGPGYLMVIPVFDRVRKVSMQTVTMPIPAQEGITRDNVTVRVDAVVYFKVVDPVEAIIQVEDYRFAVSQMAQTSLRSIIGKSDLDDLLSDREKLNQGLELMIESPAVGWGVQVDRVEIKDVSLPETMKRSMSRQAEAERDRRARVINADAEFQASKKLSQAAAAMSATPAALQLRLMQTMMSVASEKNSTLVLPFPVELLRFFDRMGQTPATQPQPQPSGAPLPDPSQLEIPDPSELQASSAEDSLVNRLTAGAGAAAPAEPLPLVDELPKRSPRPDDSSAPRANRVESLDTPTESEDGELPD